MEVPRRDERPAPGNSVEAVKRCDGARTEAAEEAEERGGSEVESTTVLAIFFSSSNVLTKLCLVKTRQEERGERRSVGEFYFRSVLCSIV